MCLLFNSFIYGGDSVIQNPLFNYIIYEGDSIVRGCLIYNI